MMMHAWTNYVKYAWGQNELKPIARSGYSAKIFGHGTLGATIIDAADTLYIMGLYSEYIKARDWIANSFNFDTVSIKLPYKWIYWQVKYLAICLKTSF